MKNRAFLLGLILFFLNLLVDGVMVTKGLIVMGIFSFLGTILVFSAVIVWLIYKDDQKLHFRGAWRIIPLAIFGVAVFKAMSQNSLEISETSESLSEVGNLLMSRYQVGLWIVSVLIFFSFVIAGSLMTRKKA